MHRAQVTIAVVVTLLLSIGVVMIYSTSAIYAEEKYHDSYFFLKKQVAWVLIGVLLMVAFSLLDYHVLKTLSIPLLFLSTILLLLVFVPGLGRTAGGARRWLRVASLSFQPSEFTKFAILVYLSDFLSRNQAKIGRIWKGLFLPLSIILLNLVLVLLQPDLGTAVLIGLVVFVLLFAGGMRITYLVTVALASLPVIYAVILRSAYQRSRIMIFLNPWKDPQGTGFQIIQSLIALDAGGLFGLGLACSRQKFFYLPEAHTDFIFSIIGEELGLVGTLCILALFFVFVMAGMKIAWNAPDLYGSLLATGIVSLIAFQAIINIGVVTGAFPTKGLPLPFVSFGGSNLVVAIASVGVLLNIGGQSTSWNLKKGRENCRRTAKRREEHTGRGKWLPEWP